MIATILDVVTGEIKTVEGPCSYMWAEGNWSCDCNRAPYFNIEIGEDICTSERFIVIGARANRDDYMYTLREFNEGYPMELLKQYLL